MSGFQDDLFLQFGDCVQFALSVVRESDAVLASLDKMVCCYQPVLVDDSVILSNDPYRSLAGTNNHVFQVVPRLNYDKQLRKVETDIPAERAENTAIEERERRQRVTYGATIQLRDLASGNFVTLDHSGVASGKRKTSPFVLEPFALDMTFKILPGSKARADGDPVFIGDKIFLATQKNSVFITVAGPLQHPDPHDADTVRLNQPLDFISEGYHKLDNSNSSGGRDRERSLWTILRFAESLPADTLAVGDVVQLVQRQHQCLMSITLAESTMSTITERPEPFLRFTEMDVTATQGVRISEFWELLRIPDPQSLVLIQAGTQGGGVRWSDRVRIRHVLSGKYLAVNQTDALKVFAGGSDAGGTAGGAKGGSGILRSPTSEMLMEAAEAPPILQGDVPDERDVVDDIARVELVAETSDNTAWRLIPSDSTLDKQGMVQLGNILLIQNIKSAYYLHIGAKSYRTNATDGDKRVPPALDLSVATAQRPVTADVVLDTLLPTAADATASVHLRRAPNVGDIWGFEHVDRQYVALLYTSSHILRQMQRVLAGERSGPRRPGDNAHKARLNSLEYFLDMFLRLVTTEKRSVSSTSSVTSLSSASSSSGTSLTTLEEWVQYMVAAQGGLDVLLQVLIYISDHGIWEPQRQQARTPGDVQRKYELLVTLCVRAMTWLVLGNAVTAAAMYKQIRVLMWLQLQYEECGSEVHVKMIRLLRAIFTASRELCERLSETEVKHVLNLCGKPVRFGRDEATIWKEVMVFLTSLCMWDRQALIENQSVIGRTLFATAQDVLIYEHLLWRYHADRKAEVYLFVTLNDARVTTSALQSPDASVTTDQTDRFYYEYHIHMLDLLSMLSHSRHDSCSANIRKLFPVQLVQHLVQRSSVDMDLRIRLFSLLRHAYVFQANTRAISISLMRKWPSDAVAAGLASAQLDSDLTTLFAWMCGRFLNMSNAEDAFLRNLKALQLLVAVLKTIRVMATAGYLLLANKALVEELLQSLSQWILSPQKEPDGSAELDDLVSRHRYDVQMEACRILFLLQQLASDHRMQLLWKAFVVYEKDPRTIDDLQGPANRPINDQDDTFRTCIQLINTATTAEVDRYFGEDESAVKKLLSSSGFDVSYFALRLLLGRWRQTESTLETLSRVMVVSARDPCVLAAEMRVNALTREASKGAMSGSIQVLNAFADLLFFLVDEDDALTRNITAAEASTALDARKPIPLRQHMLRVLGVHDPTVYLLQSSSVLDRKDMLQLAYRFLHKLVECNKQNQELFKQHFSLHLLHLSRNIGADALLEQLMTNPYLVASLSEHDIHTLLNLPNRYGTQPRFLALLSRLCGSRRVGEQIFAKNQAMVLRHLQDNRTTLFPLIRNEIPFVMQRDGTVSDGATLEKYLYHCQFIQVLADTCMGQNGANQYVVRMLCPEWLSAGFAVSNVTTNSPRKFTPTLQNAYWNYLYSVLLDCDPAQLSEEERKSMCSLLLRVQNACDLVLNSSTDQEELDFQWNVVVHSAEGIAVFLRHIYDTISKAPEGIERKECVEQLLPFESDSRQAAAVHLAELADRAQRLTLAIHLDMGVVPNDQVDSLRDNVQDICTNISRILVGGVNQPVMLHHPSTGHVQTVEEDTTLILLDTVMSEKWKKFVVLVKKLHADRVKAEARSLEQCLTSLDGPNLKQLIVQATLTPPPGSRAPSDSDFVVDVLKALNNMLTNSKFRVVQTRQRQINEKGGTVRALELLSSPDPRIKALAMKLLERLLDRNSDVQDTLRAYLHPSSTPLATVRQQSFLLELDTLLQRATSDIQRARFAGGKTVSKYKSVQADMDLQENLLDSALLILKFWCANGNSDAQQMMNGQDSSGGRNFVVRLLSFVEMIGLPRVDGKRLPLPISEMIQQEAVELRRGTSTSNTERMLMCLEALAPMVQGPYIPNQIDVLRRGLKSLEDILSYVYWWEPDEIDTPDELPSAASVAVNHPLFMPLSAFQHQDRYLLRAALALMHSLLEGPLHDVHALLMRHNIPLLTSIRRRILGAAWAVEMLRTRPREDESLVQALTEDGMLLYSLHAYLMETRDPAKPNERTESDVAWASRSRRRDEQQRELDMLDDEHEDDLLTEDGSGTATTAKRRHHHKKEAVWTKRFNEKLCRIEILRDGEEEEDQLQVVFFQTPLLVDNLRGSDRVHVLDAVNSSTAAADKIEDFHNMITDIYTTLRTRVEVKRSPFRRFITNETATLLVSGFMMVLTLVLNCILMVPLTLIHPQVQNILRWTFGGLQLLCIAFINSSMLVLDHRTNMDERYSRYLRRQRKQDRSFVQEGATRALFKLWFYIDGEVLYRSASFAASVLGLAHSIYWFSFHMLELLISTPARPVLINVTRAVTKNWKSLVLTLLLGVIIIYIFSIIGFAYYSAQLSCGNIVQCFLSMVAQFPSSGDVLRQNLTGNVGGMIFQLVFYFLVIVILLNMLFGIIVDTFAQIRNERDLQEMTLKSKCFICDVPALVYDREANGFVAHTRYEHNMWNYLKFYCHVREKTRAQSKSVRGLRRVMPLDGNEQYMQRCFDSETQHTAFYPVGVVSRTVRQSRALRKKKPDKKDYSSELKELRSTLREMAKEFKSVRAILKDSEIVLKTIRDQSGKLEDPDALLQSNADPLIDKQE
eukprot:TRINITY_DN6305_c0_g1_i1.p1 TRINITY_DN6305_c0_g1~~TRINITY_DN6305_c0_g1_i1.p1  ORF type:complete len:2627 (-),score=633.27 TRINITY_DN6305_c0_g1_i1:3269-11149(-)